MRRPIIAAFTGENDFLSNFYLCRVRYQGIIFPSVEHGFQACKTLSRKLRWRISRLPTAAAAKRAGKKLQLRSDWETNKEDIMHHFLIQKFKNPELREKLLATGNAKLIEGNWWGDTYWGVYGGKGQNRLGKLLMQVRKKLFIKFIKNEKGDYENYEYDE